MIFRSKATWTKVVNSNVKAVDESLWLSKMPCDTVIIMHKLIHTKFNTHRAWINAKFSPEITIPLNISLICAYLYGEEKQLLSDKCGRFFVKEN